MAKITTVVINRGEPGPAGSSSGPGIHIATSAPTPTGAGDLWYNPSVDSAGAVALTDGQFAMNVGGTLVARTFTTQVAAAPVLSSLAVNVKAAGAVGDGVADDTTVLTACINAGGQVYLPKGTYKYTTALPTTASVTLIGDGWTNSVLRAATADAAFKAPDTTTARNYGRITGVQIENGGTTPVGLDLRGCSHWIIDHCVITGFSTQNVRIGTDGATSTTYPAGWSNAFQDCIIQQAPTCIYGGYGFGFTDIRHCQITPTNASGSVAVDLYGSSDTVNIVTNDISYAAKATGVHLHTGVLKTLILGNRFESTASDATVTAYPIQIDSGAKFTHVKANTYTDNCRQPWVNDADPENNYTIWEDHYSFQSPATLGTAPYGYLSLPSWLNSFTVYASPLINLTSTNYFVGSNTWVAIDARHDGETNPRYQMDTDGRMGWGNAGGALDTHLQRFAANVLQTLGAFKVLAAVTGSRLSASTAGAGAMMYDTTLSKPIFSDGTTWRDAAGTAV